MKKLIAEFVTYLIIAEGVALWWEYILKAPHWFALSFGIALGLYATRDNK